MNNCADCFQKFEGWHECVYRKDNIDLAVLTLFELTEVLYGNEV